MHLPLSSMRSLCQLMPLSLIWGLASFDSLWATQRLTSRREVNAKHTMKFAESLAGRQHMPRETLSILRVKTPRKIKFDIAASLRGLWKYFILFYGSLACLSTRPSLPWREHHFVKPASPCAATSTMGMMQVPIRRLRRTPWSLTYSQSIGNAHFFMLSPTFTVIILDPSETGNLNSWSQCGLQFFRTTAVECLCAPTLSVT